MVLRKQVGDQIMVTDGKGNLMTCQIDALDKAVVECSILDTEFRTNPEKLILAVAPTKNRDRLEWMIEKLVEIGVKDIILLQTMNTERNKINQERLYKKAISAMKQSLRVHLPQIKNMDHSDVLAIEAEGKYIAHCHQDLPRSAFRSSNVQTLMLIGPEGDFSELEVQEAVRHGFRSVELGQFRLRTETAALFAAAQWSKV